ncbi:MAG: FAD-binding protein [Bilophila wadsworthia]
MVRIVASPRMASLTSLHLGGRALALATFESAADLETLPEAADRIGGAVCLARTNILAADGELLRCARPLRHGRSARRDRANGGLRLVRVGAGVKLPRLLVWCMKHGLSGLEGMAGVPGDVGGAVAGNAGAHGMDMGTVLRSVDVFSPDRGFRTLWREDVRCEYRFFGLRDGGKPWFAISGIVLALRPAELEAIRTALQATISNALRVQPVRSWSAGAS